MGVEIERKFLIISDDWRTDVQGNALTGTRFRQGYLADSPVTVRIRLEGEEGRLTIKGPTRQLTRLEYEFPIDSADAAQLLEQLCQSPLIEKYRYKQLGPDGLVWEIDEFLGDNAGLILAEVELNSENQPVVMPSWVGSEVSDDPRYYNVNLARHPYRDWAAPLSDDGQTPPVPA
jgi:adenylate cyclase